MMLELIAPNAGMYEARLAAHVKWGPGLHEDGFGLTPTDDVETAAGFAQWIDRLNAAENLCACRWIVDGGLILGGIALRLQDDDFTRQHGHVGYGVRPTARGHRVASRAFEGILDLARLKGLTRVLAVCESENEASARTIERLGGALEGGSEASDLRRYWIDLGK